MRTVHESPLDKSDTPGQTDTANAAGSENRKRSRGGPYQRLTIGALLVIILLTAAWNGRQVVELWQDEPAQALAQFGARRPAPGQSFDLSGATIPANEIHGGGPPKDGIPALTNPKYVTAANAQFLQPEDRVIGFAEGNEARAYPLRILNFHEIVNDRVADQEIAVTYCPLCDSAAVFDRQTPLGLLELGVSGLLYNSNVLMYDRSKKESLWSQLKSEGISGPGAAKTLQTLPVELTTWQDWRRRHPQTLVLSPDTGHPRNYARDPYAGYFEQPRLMFPARPSSDRLPVKERVLGVWTENSSKAYPLSAFSSDRNRVQDELDGHPIEIEFLPEANTLRVVEAPEEVQWMYSLWFAWYAMRPDTEVFK